MKQNKQKTYCKLQVVRAAVRNVQICVLSNTLKQWKTFSWRSKAFSKILLRSFKVQTFYNYLVEAESNIRKMLGRYSTL